MDFQLSPDDYWDGDDFHTRTADGRRVIVSRYHVCPTCGMPTHGTHALIDHQISEHPPGELIVWTAEEILYREIYRAFGPPHDTSRDNIRCWDDFEVQWTWENEYVVALTPAGVLWLRLNMTAQDRVLYEKKDRP